MKHQTYIGLLGSIIILMSGCSAIEDPWADASDPSLIDMELSFSDQGLNVVTKMDITGVPANKIRRTGIVWKTRSSSIGGPWYFEASPSNGLSETILIFPWNHFSEQYVSLYVRGYVETEEYIYYGDECKYSTNFIDVFPTVRLESASGYRNEVTLTGLITAGSDPSLIGEYGFRWAPRDSYQYQYLPVGTGMAETFTADVTFSEAGTYKFSAYVKVRYLQQAISSDNKSLYVY